MTEGKVEILAQKKSSKKGSIAVIIILVLIILGLVGYISYDKYIISGDKVNNEEKQKVSNVINFNRNNCINSDFSDDRYVISRFGSSVNVDGLSFSIDPKDEKIVNIQARYDIIFPGKYSEQEIRDGSVEYSDWINLKFDKRVESIFGGLFAADGTRGTVFLFLLDDGSVEYMKYSDIYDSKNYEHLSVSSVVKDIVKFDNIALSPKQDAGAKYTAIAYKIDGTYYDLSEFIKFN